MDAESGQSGSGPITAVNRDAAHVSYWREAEDDGSRNPAMNFAVPSRPLAPGQFTKTYRGFSFSGPKGIARPGNVEQAAASALW